MYGLVKKERKQDFDLRNLWNQIPTLTFGNLLSKWMFLLLVIYIACGLLWQHLGVYTILYILCKLIHACMATGLSATFVSRGVASIWLSGLELPPLSSKKWAGRGPCKCFPRRHPLANHLAIRASYLTPLNNALCGRGQLSSASPPLSQNPGYAPVVV